MQPLNVNGNLNGARSRSRSHSRSHSPPSPSPMSPGCDRFPFPDTPSIPDLRKIQSSPHNNEASPTTPVLIPIYRASTPVGTVKPQQIMINSPVQKTNNGQVIKPRISLKDRMAMFQQSLVFLFCCVFWKYHDYLRI